MMEKQQQQQKRLIKIGKVVTKHCKRGTLEGKPQSFRKSSSMIKTSVFSILS